jgi:Trk K+ transport system NAD-binding subunit
VTYADRIGHVVVCGLHGVGLRTVEQFVAAGVPVVVVDDEPDPRLIRQLSAWGVPCLAASSRLPETLHAAGLAGARALVCVEEDDVHTLETTLLARRLRADLRIVVQLSNPAVGAALAEVTGPGSVLDTAVLSAPSVVEACVRSDRHELDLGGERFLVREEVADHPGTLRSLYGDLAPIAVLPADGGAMVICPGRDHRVRPGDRIGLLGPATVDGPDPGAAPRRRPRPLAAARRTAASLLSEVDRPFRWTVAALVGWPASARSACRWCRVDQQPFLLGQLSVTAAGGLAGRAMQEVSARTRVIALSRAGGGLEYPPRRGTRFAAGDQAYLVGPYEELLRVLRQDQQAQPD